MHGTWKRHLGRSAKRGRRCQSPGTESPTKKCDNKDAFDYVVQNQLWYKEGVVNKIRNGEIDFPAGSISIKGKWKLITEEEKKRYHWHEYVEPTTGKPAIVGLVALHIGSKVIPNWHWSTFEQVDNPGFADYIGVHDSFGMRPTDIWPNRQTNQGYSETYGKSKDNVGQLTDQVKALMKQHKLSPALSTYYRLKGAQVDFTDRTGRPTIVGNSITEAGFVSTSSCITCHARASIGAVPRSKSLSGASALERIHRSRRKLQRPRRPQMVLGSDGNQLIAPCPTRSLPEICLILVAINPHAQTSDAGAGGQEGRKRKGALRGQSGNDSRSASDADRDPADEGIVDLREFKSLSGFLQSIQEILMIGK